MHPGQLPLSLSFHCWEQAEEQPQEAPSETLSTLRYHQLPPEQ